MISDYDLSDFAVITPISNSPAYAIRAQNYFRFRDMCQAAGVRLITAEAAFGERPFEVTERDNPDHWQGRTQEELWLKENLCNVAIRHAVQMYPEIKYVAWVDSDCFPMSTPREWFLKTRMALDHYQIVQMWDYLINMGPDNQPISQPQMSYMKCYEANGFQVPLQKTKIKHTLAGHSGMVSIGRPGLAWAASLDILGKLGMLYQTSILGSGDYHMARCFTETVEEASQEFKLSEYAKSILDYQTLCKRYLKRDVGYVKMTVGHWYHGDKKDRRYGDRGAILVRNGYTPRLDVKADQFGLLQLETHEERQIRLRDEIRAYFSGRNEDSIPLR